MDRNNELMQADMASQLPETIFEAFAAVACRAPERMAMQIKQGAAHRQFTYGQTTQQVKGLAAALIRQGIRRGDRVAIVAENRPEWVIAYVGIVAAGGTAVPLDVQLSSRDLASLLARSDSRAIFVSEKTWPLLKELSLPPTVVSLDPVPDSRCLNCDEFVRAEPAEWEKPTVTPEDVASLLYTSGTTGEPKGVRLSHRNLLSNAKALMSSGIAGPDDHFLAILPLHHTYPFMVTGLVPLLLGAQLTFLTTLKGPELAHCLREAHITVFVGVPQVFAMIRRAILEGIDRRPRAVRLVIRSLLVLSGFMRRHMNVNLGRLLFAAVHRKLGPSLRILASGGARLDPQVAEDFYRLGFTPLEGYGLTETAPVVTMNPLAKPKIGSVGVPIPGVDVRIVNPDAAGIGEVAVRGPNVMQGYDGNPQATADAIRDGWFYTGDLGYLDRDGYLYITGRAKELIVTAGGKNIAPEELEAHYLASPAITEICLVGEQRAGEGGEGLHAVVLPNFDYIKELQVVDVRQLMKDELTRIGLTLPPYKRISGLSIVTVPLPRTRLGKIQRFRVAAMLVKAEAEAKPVAHLSDADQSLMETDAARHVVAALEPFVEKGRRIAPDDHLELDLGFDSLRRVELFTSLERRCGPLPETAMLEVMTVRELIETLTRLAHGPVMEGTGTQSWGDLLKVEPPPAVRDYLLRPRGVHHRIIDSCTRAVLRLIFHGVFHLRVTGLEHLPPTGPFLLAANHTSYLDPFAIVAAVPSPVFARLHFMGWQAYFRNIFTAWVARVGRVIPVGMEASLVTALRAVSLVLRQGKGVLIFPEGQRAVNGELKPFRHGIGVLACELGIPVVPVRIEGTHEAWPVGARWPRRRPISLACGSPIAVTPQMLSEWRSTGHDPYQTATAIIREAIVSLGAQASSPHRS